MAYEHDLGAPEISSYDPTEALSSHDNGWDRSADDDAGWGVPQDTGGGQLQSSPIRTSHEREELEEKGTLGLAEISDLSAMPAFTSP